MTLFVVFVFKSTIDFLPVCLFARPSLLSSRNLSHIWIYTLDLDLLWLSDKTGRKKNQKDNAELLFKFDLNSGRSSKKHLMVYGLESASYITLSSSSNQELESRSWVPEYRFSGSNLFWSPIQKDIRDQRSAAAHTFNILLYPLPWQLLSLYLTSQYESSLLLTQLHYYTTSSSSWKLAISTIYSWKWAIFHVPQMFHPRNGAALTASDQSDHTVNKR